AMEEAIFLSKFASKVTIVHRRDEFRASKIMLERAREQQNIEFLTPYLVKEFVAGSNGALGHATLENVQSGEQRELIVTGAFVAIRHAPQSGLRSGPPPYPPIPPPLCSTRWQGTTMGMGFEPSAFPAAR